MSSPKKNAHVILDDDYIFFGQRKTDIISTGSIVNVYIVYKIYPKSITSTNALRNGLFGASKALKTTTNDPRKYNYTGYGIAFSSNTLKHPDTGGTGKNVIIFGANTENLKNKNNKKQSIMVLGYGSVKINDTDIYAKKSYTPDFTAGNKITCLSLHYNGDNSYPFVNGKQTCKFKAKDTEINKHSLALRNIADNSDLSDSDIKSGKFYENIYDFSVGYEQISKENILKIHTYLMKKWYCINER